MHEDSRTFGYKMRHALSYRLMTASLVFILPVCIIGCILLGVVRNRTEREMRAIEQDRLKDAMEYWQRDSRTVDGAMEYFVTLFLDELNNDSTQSSETALYRMFTQLERILPAADHSGLLAMRDNRSGKILTQMRDGSADAAATDGRVRLFTQLAAEDTMADAVWQEIGGQYYLLKRFDYRNNSIFIGLDVGNSILERTAAIRDENAHVYASDGELVVELTPDGPMGTELTWEKCIASGWNRTATSWQSQSLPVAVCIVEESSLFQRVPPEYWALVILFLICVANTGNLWRIIQLEMLEPAKLLSDAMRQIQNGNLSYRLYNDFYRNSDEMQYLFNTFDEMADEVEASREKDKKMYQAEMDNLRLQVNPHMLLNSLNTIYSLAQTHKFEAIQEYALHLVDYFRYALRRNDTFVTLRQELDFIQTYVEIQKIRYPGALSFVYEVDEDCRDAKVPPLLIQNFIENSVKYAVTPGKVTEILLDVQRQEDRLVIAVTDTGNGIKPDVLEALNTGEPYVDALGQKHIGIWNCRRRIEVFYRENPKLEIFSVADKTQVVLDIPFVTEV